MAAEMKLDEAEILSCIEKSWISPRAAIELDEEDIARIYLIDELRRDFGVNDEAIPLILYLVDQLCALRMKAGQYALNS